MLPHPPPTWVRFRQEFAGGLQRCLGETSCRQRQVVYGLSSRRHAHAAAQQQRGNADVLGRLALITPRRLCRYRRVSRGGGRVVACRRCPRLQAPAPCHASGTPFCRFLYCCCCWLALSEQHGCRCAGFCKGAACRLQNRANSACSVSQHAAEANQGFLWLTGESELAKMGCSKHGSHTRQMAPHIDLSSLPASRRACWPQQYGVGALGRHCPPQGLPGLLEEL